MLTRTAFPVITMTTGSADPVWTLPERVIPEPFGVEIHFTDATAWELDLLANGGIKVGADGYGLGEGRTAAKPF